MKYANSFLDLMSNLEGVLGSAVIGGIADSATIGIVPRSVDFAQWMTSFDADFALEDDVFTPDEIQMELETDEDGEQNLEPMKYGDVTVLPYILDINRDIVVLLCEDADSKAVDDCSCSERKKMWAKPSEHLELAEELSKSLLAASDQHHEDYFWYINQDCERRDIRYFVQKEGEIVIYVELCSKKDEEYARLEAEFYFRVTGAKANTLAWLAVELVEAFAAKSDCWVQTDWDRPKHD